MLSGISTDSGKFTPVLTISAEGCKLFRKNGLLRSNGKIYIIILTASQLPLRKAENGAIGKRVTAAKELSSSNEFCILPGTNLENWRPFTLPSVLNQ